MNITSEKILDIITAFDSEKDYFKLLNVILTKMMEISDADAGTLYILEDGRLHFKIIRNITLDIFQSEEDKINLPPITLDENNIVNVCAYSAIKNEIVMIDDVYENGEFNFSGPKRYDEITGYRTQSMLVMPLTASDNGIVKIIGVIQLINSADKETGGIKPFDNIYEPPVLPSLANISANALANLLHSREIKELFNSFVKVMTKAIDERSPYNVNHTNNVAMYAERFCYYLNSRFPAGHELYFSENRREQLVMAGLLHDIGKIITPLEIMDKPDRLGARLDIIGYKFELKRCQLEIELLKNIISQAEYNNYINELDTSLELIKSVNTAGFLSDDLLARVKLLEKIKYFNENQEPEAILTPSDMEALTTRKGTLTKDEYKIMQEHASVTSRLLGEMAFNEYYKNVRSWAESHHEFLDGTGYPKGLAGSDVTVEMCILTILDIYDALTANDRPYKKAVPAEKALEILKSMADEGKLHGELTRLFNESNVWR